MNNTCQESRALLEPLDERLDIFFREIELAIKWQRPSILFAVYPSAAAHAEIEAALENQIIGFGQQVMHVRGEEGGDPDISLFISQVPDTDRVIFFVDGLSCGSAAEGHMRYRALNVSREYFVERQIRIVFWLTEAEAVSLAHDAPDFWASRHRVIDFIESQKPDETFARVLESAWQGQGEDKHMTDNLVDTHAKISLRETTQAGLPEWDGSTTAGVNLLLTLGIMHWRKGDHEKADESLRSALDIAIKTQDKRLEAVCFNAIALVKADLGLLDEAVEAYEQAIELAPEKTFIWGHLGNLYSQLGLYPEAVEAFLNTLEHNPVDSIVWNSLGNAYVKIGQVDEAIDAYRKALELNERFVEPWMSLGALFKQQGLAEEAIKAYQKAAEIDSTNVRAWNELSNIYFELGAFDEAIETYNITIKLGAETGTVYCNLASAYARKEEFASAIPFYVKSIELFENDAERARAWNELGDVYRQVKEYDNAISAYQQADKLTVVGEAVAASQLSYLNSLASGANIVDETATDLLEQVRQIAGAETQAAQPEAAAVAVETPADQAEAAPETDPQPVVEPAAAEAAAPVTETEPASQQESAGLDEVAAPADAAQQPLAEDGDNAAPSPETEESVAVIDAATPAQDAGPAAEPVAEETLPAPEAVAEPVAEQAASAIEPEQPVEAVASAQETPEPAAADPAQEVVAPAEAAADLPAEAQEMIVVAEETQVVPVEPAASGEAIPDAAEIAAELEEALAAEAPEEIEEVVLLDETIAQPEAAQPETADAPAEPAASPENDLQNAHIWNELGNIYFKVGAYDEALDAYNKAVELGLQLGLLYSNLGFACAHTGRYAEAVPLYQKSIELLEDHADRAVSWSRLGDAYGRLNEVANALAAYENALELDPTNVSFLDGLNQIRSQLVPPAAAAPVEAPVAVAVEPAQADEPVAPEAPAASETLVDDDDAEDALPEPQEDESDDGVVADLVAHMFEEQDIPDVASAEADAGLLETAPVAEAVAEETAAPLAQAVEPEPAQVEDVAVAKESAPIEVVMVAEDAAPCVDEAVLEAAPETGTEAAAEPVDSPAFEKEPAGMREIDLKNAHIWNELGHIFARAANFDDAIDAYSKAIDLDPAFAWPYSNLGLVLAQKGQFADAIPLYQKSIELFDSPKDKAVSWNRLGDAFRQLNEYTDAIGAYQIADELTQNDPENAAQEGMREVNLAQPAPLFSYLYGGSNDRF